MSSDTDKVAAALAACFADVSGGIAKDGRNDHHRFDFTSEAAIAAHVRPHLAKHGLVVMPRSFDAVYTIAQNSRGKDEVVCRLRAMYWLVHKSGQMLELESVGEGRDAQDKATAKAQTMAYKTMWLELFCLARGYDPDGDGGSPADDVPGDAGMMWKQRVAHATRDAKSRGWDRDDFEKLLSDHEFGGFGEVEDEKVRGALITLMKGEPWTMRGAS